MARVDVRDGEGREASRIWQLAPHLGVGGFCVEMGRAFQVLDISRDFDVLWSREPKEPQ